MKTIVPFCFLMLTALGEKRSLDYLDYWNTPYDLHTSSLCPNGKLNCRSAWNGNCWPHGPILERERFDFWTAEQICTRGYSGQGHLASFHSKEQFDFLLRFAYKEAYWIGLTKINKDQWSFTDGSPFDFVPAKLRLGTAKVAALNPSDGYLHDVPASTKLRYICLYCEPEPQWPVKQFPHVTDNRSDRTCKHGVCYKVGFGRRTYLSAESFCVANEGHLASFHSRKQYDFLIEMSSGHDVWVGADNRNGQNWMFTDGSPMDFVPPWTKFDAVPRQACVLMYQGYRLEDQPCTDRRYYICVLPYIPDWGQQ